MGHSRSADLRKSIDPISSSQARSVLAYETTVLSATFQNKDFITVVKSFRLVTTFRYRSCHGNDNGLSNFEQGAPVQIFINQRRLVLNIVKLSF